MKHKLKRENTALLVIDVQEKLFRFIDHACEMMQSIQMLVKGFQILDCPIVLTEQYPQGLGETLPALKELLEKDQLIFSKTSFSCLGDASIQEKILALPATQWVLTGMEAHVCVLQTARDLLEAGKEVVVVNDGISSRSIYNFSTAIAELRDLGARVTSSETVLFELVADAKNQEFQQISKLIK